jgi:hypothetical protein
MTLDMRGAAMRSRDLGSHRARSLILASLALVASVAAMVMLVRQADSLTLDYDVGIVPSVVPWAAALVTLTAAVLGLGGRDVAPMAGSLLIGGIVVLAAWAAVMLPFDALRLVGLVPLPLSAWGAATRLLLLVGAACAFLAWQDGRGAKGRCPACRRVLPGRLDRLPRWPVVVAVVAALVYPALRVGWALGGTFGTAGGPLRLDAAVAWGTVLAGAALVAFAVVLLVSRGPRWIRALLGLGGAALGVLLAILGGLGALKATATLLSDGPGAVIDDLMAWTYVVVYGSWSVSGLGLIVGGLRFWSHRRDACPECKAFMSQS